MPITAEQASLWSPSGHADALIPIPQGRLTVADTLQILDFSVAVVHCFLPSEEAPAIFSISGFSRENQLCRLILEKVRSRRATLHGKSGTAGASRSTDADISFRRGYGHENEVLESNRNVPFLRLMFLPSADAIMRPYISEAVRWMLSGGSIRQNFVPILWMGLRDWATSSAWTRGQTLLAARAYKEHVAVTYLTRKLAQQPVLALVEGAAHSLAHAASLTARQARRSGVSEGELRARWA